ncbi:MAG: hypothetical protein ACRDP4_03210, partial [Nocardioidaceae bacterium]
RRAQEARPAWTVYRAAVETLDWLTGVTDIPPPVDEAAPPAGVSAATGDCPETATMVPAGGHGKCPLMVVGSARHDVVCLAVVRGWGPFLGCDERC